ncbi:enterochelin esterase [Streptomyces sp. NPDC058045]|uniref:enterochelin esterase n=1 Tax=Streptomyces sp. NPDC058045 TaxID=3346311 RepID=UPI0036EBC099
MRSTSAVLAAPPTGAPHHPPRLARPHPLPLLPDPVCELPAPGAELEFWAEARRRGTPLIGPDPEGSADHCAVTFLHRGTPHTRAVLALPNKLTDPRAPEANLMRRAPGTDVWHWTVRLRQDWYGSYDLCADDGEEPLPEPPGSPAHWQALRTRHRPDRYNSRTLPRRWGGEPVPWAALPGAPEGADWEPRAGVPRGTAERHLLPGASRHVWLYTPPATAPADPEGLPVLVLLDGEHWQSRLGLAHLLDNLIADGRIPPLAAVLPESVDPARRWADMTCRPEFADFLTGELLPWAAARLPLTTDPARTVIAGQSLGGLTAAYTACRAPHRFGAVLAQSGSFWWPADHRSQWLTGALARGPRLPVRFRLSFGEQEWVALPAAHRLRDTLAAAGYRDAVYREFNGGHDYLCWRTELADGLVELLGGG